MSFHSIQFREWVLRPALKAIDMESESAVNLLLLTCAVESGMGRYLKQIGTNIIGGYGIYQIELATYNDIWDRKIKDVSSMRAKIRLNCGYEGKPPYQRLITDLALSTIICRLIYAQHPEPLPDAKNIPGLAAYWKKYYNTELGKGTVDKAIEAYDTYV